MIVKRTYNFLYHNLAIMNGKEEYNILKECYEVDGKYNYMGKDERCEGRLKNEVSTLEK